MSSGVIEYCRVQNDDWTAAMNATPAVRRNSSARSGQRKCSGEGMTRPTSAKLNPARSGAATDPALSAAAW